MTKAIDFPGLPINWMVAQYRLIGEGLVPGQSRDDGILLRLLNRCAKARDLLLDARHVVCQSQLIEGQPKFLPLRLAATTMPLHK